MSLEPGPSGDPVDPEAAGTIGAATARAYSLVPVGFDGGTLVVALSDPEDEEAVRVLRQLVRREVKAVISTPAAIDRAQERVYGPRPEPSVARRSAEHRDPPPATP